MVLTYGLTTVRDLFAKLQRDAALLEKGVTSDGFFNFVVTGYSMIDWVKRDPSVPDSAKAAAADLHRDRWITICGDLANASKHFSLTKRKPVIASASPAHGYGLGPFGTGAFGDGGDSIVIQLNGGECFHCFELVQGVLSSWKVFFASHGIEVERQIEDVSST